MKNLQGKRLLLLGGNMFKESIKQIAETYGIYLIAVSNDPNAEIFDIADEKYIISSTDSEKMKSFIREHNIDGVYMGCSEPVISVACQYIHELGLPCYCTKEQWDFLQNKINFKNLCIKHGLPVVPQYTPEDSFKNIPESDFPVIVKPADGCGSRGFSVCNSREDLKSAVQIAKDNSDSNTALIEKFVKNEGVVVFYTFSNGKAYFSGLEDKYPVKYSETGRYVLGMMKFESRFTKEFREKFEDKLTKAFADIGICEGTIWIEVFHDEENYYFNEAGFRYGGSISIYPVDYISNINQLAADMYFALTGESKIYGHLPLVPPKYTKGKNYCVYSLYVLPGKITEIKGLDKIQSLDNVVVVPSSMGIGTEVSNTGTIAQVFGFVHFIFESFDECKEVADFIHANLKIIDENGNNMLIKKIDFNKRKIVL